MSRKIAYYITAHGFGHAVRSSYLINELGRTCEITILTDIPESFFIEELSVPFSYRAAQFDCGCIQKDAVTLDSQATAAEYARISVQNDAVLPQEIRWIKESGIELIVSDLVPFAGVIAAKAGVPSVSVSNFWWDDIYRQFPETEDIKRLVRRIEAEMGYFSHHVLLNPAMKKWESGANILSGVNLLREARNRSAELHSYLKIDPSLKIALIYTGNYGMDSVEWKKLESFKGWHFIGLYDLPENPENFTKITKTHFSMQEFTASADAVVSKLGYGTVTESLSSGTPILYTPRDGFAEFPVLENYLKRFGFCARVEDEQFRELAWENELNTLCARGKRTFKLTGDTKMIAEWILSVPRLVV